MNNVFVESIFCIKYNEDKIANKIILRKLKSDQRLLEVQSRITHLEFIVELS
jgi:hypothetical protein